MSAAGWGSITGRADRVLIVGTGPSAASLDYRKIPKDVYVIAVKDAVKFLPRFDAWVTVDLNDRCFPILQDMKPGVEYYAAATARQAARWRFKGLRYIRRQSLGEINAQFKMSNNPEFLVSGNSAFAAMQVAYLKQAKRILIVGVDGTNEPHVTGGQPRGSLEHLPRLFATALPQLQNAGVRVATVGLQSRLQCFQRLLPEAAFAWLTAPRTALALGSANCMWADVDAFLEIGEADGIVAAKGAGVVWPGPVDAWASLHPEKMRNMILDRASLGHPPIKRVYVHRMTASSRRYCTHELDYKFDIQKSSGSSGLFAVKVALEALHFDLVVMCGMPLDPDQGRLDGLRVWSGRKHFEKGIREAVPAIKDRVRSMSGLTRDLLGAPTPEWLSGER